MTGRLLLVIALLLGGFWGTASAQEKPPVRLRLSSLSVRNRSCAPIAVQVKLEYNDPKILEGDLELYLYDALDIVSPEDMLASMKYEGIVLSGSDYIFHTILPPVPTSTLQNLAVQAWFRTKDGNRIPLSSSLKDISPPKPHDLLMISPLERATTICSCRASTTAGQSSANREFLEKSLSLENYNPAFRAEGTVETVAGGRSPQLMGRHIQYYPVDWASRDLPSNPLMLCAFDMVLFSDGGLGALSAEQLDAVLAWVQAGGSACFVADSPLKGYHLNMIQTVFQGPQSNQQFVLDDSGRLMVLTGEQPQARFQHFGLGRMVLLRAEEDWSKTLPPETMGLLNGFLWKVRMDSPIHSGQKWSSPGIEDLLTSKGVPWEKNDAGNYNIKNHYNGRQYFAEAFNLTPEQLRETYTLETQLAPLTESLVSTASVGLMPEDVEMVPTWVIALILAAYVTVIGPVDYVVLGWFRLRKFTWIAFPVVTAAFTAFTIWIAHVYMGSTETGGSIEIVDVVEDGKAIRQTRLEMLFYGSRTTHKSSHRNEISVAVADVMSPADYLRGNYRMDNPVRASGTPKLGFVGRFPDNYTISQTVQQWSPQMMRTTAILPEGVQVPQLDWNDATLVSTAGGRVRLSQTIMKLGTGSGEAAAFSVPSVRAWVLHKEKLYDLSRNPEQSMPGVQPAVMTNSYMYSDPYSSGMYGMNMKDALLHCFLDSTVATKRNSFMSIVSQVSPEGSAQLEDLPFLDSTDPRQWALVIVVPEQNVYRVYRKLYIVEPQGDGEMSDE
ncbi:MAG: hypothetical protein JNL58_03430 [Planctomyces sp.]|nr:hypothetical protein [Planctomyces sp.]